MKRTALGYALVTLSVLAFASPASGQTDLPPGGDNRIGIYTEPDFDGANSVFVEADVASMLTAYIVMTGLTVDSVHGFECLVSFEGSSVVTSTQYPVSAIDLAADPGEIQVGFAAPVLATGGNVHVCTFDYLFLTDPEWLFLGPVSVPSIPGQVVYMDGDDVTSLISLQPSSGGFDLPVYAVNYDPFEPEGASWSDVKMLFR